MLYRKRIVFEFGPLLAEAPPILSVYFRKIRGGKDSYRWVYKVEVVILVDQGWVVHGLPCD